MKHEYIISANMVNPFANWQIQALSGIIRNYKGPDECSLNTWSEN